MTGITFGVADFVSGRPLGDLPVNAGAEWAAQLNRADALSCSVGLRNPEARSLDLRAITEPNKTVLFARNDDDVILAWGLIPDDGRTWDETTQTLSLRATGVLASYFGKTIIGPAAALTAPLLVDMIGGVKTPNPALDTNLSGWSHGTIGKKLVAQRLAWPGAPQTFDLPADQPGTRMQNYPFARFKFIGSALTDLTTQEGGTDFAFDAVRAADGMTLRFPMRHGSEAVPRIGTYAGSWSLGGETPITGFTITDAVAAGPSAAWMSAGRESDNVIFSRMLNPAAITANGYPPMDVVDTSHGDVSLQTTLDSYAAELIRDAATTTRDLSFSVQADAAPSLGQYRPGDTMTIDVPSNHPWHTAAIPIRLTSISGDETGKTIKIGCVINNAP